MKKFFFFFQPNNAKNSYPIGSIQSGHTLDEAINKLKKAYPGFVIDRYREIK